MIFLISIYILIALIFSAAAAELYKEQKQPAYAGIQLATWYLIVGCALWPLLIIGIGMIRIKKYINAH